MSQMTTGRALPRRTFLRGMGTAVALPFLDAMTPAFAAASTPITRVAFVYTANGVIMQDWTPAQDGVGFAFTKTLQPVAPFRDQLVVVSGLAHGQAEPLGDGNGEHSRASATWLNGVHPNFTQGADVRAGVTADQVAAAEFGNETPLPSLELAVDLNFLVGNCDNGYSCTYQNSTSWRTATTPGPHAGDMDVGRTNMGKTRRRRFFWCLRGRLPVMLRAEKYSLTCEP